MGAILTSEKDMVKKKALFCVRLHVYPQYVVVMTIRGQATAFRVSRPATPSPVLRSIAAAVGVPIVE